MADADPTALERLQMQSLRNVRALVDKLEAEERERKGQLLITTAWVVGGVLATLAVIGFAAMQWRANKPARAVPAQAAAATTQMSVANYEDHVARLIATHGNSGGEAPARSGREGRATVRLRIKAGGYSDVETLKSSGDSAVDSAMLSLVRRSEPFGGLPADARPVPYPLTLDIALVPSTAGTRLVVAKPKT